MEGLVDALWKRTARESGRVFYSVRLDDNVLSGCVDHRLRVVEHGYALIWSRPDR